MRLLEWSKENSRILELKDQEKFERRSFQALLCAKWFNYLRPRGYARNFSVRMYIREVLRDKQSNAHLD